MARAGRAQASQPCCLGLKPLRRRLVWVLKCVVGSEDSHFPLSPKNKIDKFQFDQEWKTKNC